VKSTATHQQLETLADEIFDLVRMVSALRSRGGSEELSESEFVTLDQLSRATTLTVGEIQKQLGILPAQMSRILRALEGRSPKPYLECTINQSDRRKVDVRITDAGRKAYEQYRQARRSTSMQLLSRLDDDDRHAFMRILRTFRGEISKRLNGR
jgi:DNA-binding MarR family transcriptional regulator